MPLSPSDQVASPAREPSAGYLRAVAESKLQGADRFLTAAQVRRRYGDASDMWIWRRLHDDSGFPKPMVIGRRRLWSLTALTAWEGRAGAEAVSA
jgi:predicted DNA-binding transcriptional regulator AlpA